MSMPRGLRKQKNSSSIYIGCSFLFSGVKMVMFFLCTVECYSIIKLVFCISIKAIIWKSANQMKVWDAKLQGL